MSILSNSAMLLSSYDRYTKPYKYLSKTCSPKEYGMSLASKRKNKKSKKR